MPLTQSLSTSSSSRLRTHAFTLLAALTLPAATHSLGAQETLPRAAAVEVRARFLTDLDTLQHKFLALAEAIPADARGQRVLRLHTHGLRATPPRFPRPGRNAEVRVDEQQGRREAPHRGVRLPGRRSPDSDESKITGTQKFSAAIARSSRPR
jgi:hypothetical protein